MNNNKDNTEVSVRVNTTLEGDPARWLLDWKKRGLITSYRDAIVQAFRLYHKKIIEQDMKEAKLKQMR